MASAKRERQQVNKVKGQQEKLRKITANLPEGSLQMLEERAEREGISLGQILRDAAALLLGTESPVREQGRPRTNADRPNWRKLTPDDVPGLPPDERDGWFLSNRARFLGGKSPLGITHFTMCRTLLLWNVGGTQQMVYHFPMLDGPAKEYREIVDTFWAMYDVVKPLTPAGRLALPFWSEFRRVEAARKDPNSVVGLLKRVIWTEFAYSQLRRFGAWQTSQSLVTQGKYDTTWELWSPHRDDIPPWPDGEPETPLDYSVYLPDRTARMAPVATETA